MPPELSYPLWSSLLPGIALWALALYLPLSGPIARFEESLAAGRLDASSQQLLLVLASLALALAVGVVIEILLCWAIRPRLEDQPGSDGRALRSVLGRGQSPEPGLS